MVVLSVGVGNTDPGWCWDLRARLERQRWELLSYHWRPASLQVTPRTTVPAPDELITSARQFLGMPYSWGSAGDGGFDCSGFTNKVYAENGYDLPRTSREQYRVGQPVNRSELAMGDLLFFVTQPGDQRITHVAMYVADDE